MDFPLVTAAGEKNVDIFDAVLMTDGLKFLKTLRVGSIWGKRVAFFDRLMSQFQDHSSVDFEWDSRSSLYDIVMECRQLVQLELPTEWGTKEMDFRVSVFCI